MTIAVAVNWLSAGQLVHVAPLPGRIIQEDIRSQIYTRLLQHILVAVDSVKTEEFIDVLFSESSLGASLQIFNGRLFAHQYRPWSHLLVVTANEQRHFGLFALGKYLNRLFFHKISVDVIDRNGSYARQLHQFLGRQGTKFVEVLHSYVLFHLLACFLTHLLGYFLGKLHAFLLGFLLGGNLLESHHRTAGTHCLGKESLAERGSHQGANRHGTSRFAHDGDAVRVAAEGLDIVLHPLDGSHLVHETIVAGTLIGGFLGKLRMSEEAEDAFTIVGCDGDDSLARHCIARISRFASATGHQSSTVEINQNRQMLLHGLCRSPDIQIETILAVGLRAEVHIAEDGFLHRVRSELLCLANALPFLYRLRSLPAEISYRRGSERNALEYCDA